MTNIVAFMNDLNLPQELKDDENMLILLTILFPCTVKKIRPTEYADERE